MGLFTIHFELGDKTLEAVTRIATTGVIHFELGPRPEQCSNVSWQRTRKAPALVNWSRRERVPFGREVVSSWGRVKFV